MSTREVLTRIDRAIGRAGPLMTFLPRSVYGSLRAMQRIPSHGVPPAPATFRTAGEHALDEFVIAAQTLVREVPARGDVRLELGRVAEVASALEDLAPRDLHPVTVEPVEPAVEEQEQVRFRTRWRVLSFDTSYVLPAPLLASAERVHGTDGHRAQVRILRHEGVARPWFIVVHGAEQGKDLDLVALRARHFHEDLGLNVALPVLPLHGARRDGDLHIPGFDVVANVTFSLLAVAEMRALCTWIDHQGHPAVALYGVSLGGYLTALTAGVEAELDLVIAGIPMVSIHRLLARHATRSPSLDGQVIGALLRSEPVQALERFVDPLRFEPNVPVSQRLVLAGLVDRVTTPHQALQLWRHWGEPQIIWYPGGHVGHLWSGAVRSHVDHALSTLPRDPGFERTTRDRP